MSDQNDHGEGWQILDQVQMSPFHALYPGREVVMLGLQVTDSPDRADGADQRQSLPNGQ